MKTKTGKAVHVPSGSTANAKALASWGTRVVDAFTACPRTALDGPVAVGIIFRFPLRGGDLNARGEVKPAAPVFRTAKRDDIDKITRSTLDALVDAGAFSDDSQVAVLFACKVYVPPGQPVGATIAIGPATVEAGFDVAESVMEIWRHQACVAALDMIHVRDVAAVNKRRARSSDPELDFGGSPL